MEGDDGAFFFVWLGFSKLYKYFKETLLSDDDEEEDENALFQGARAMIERVHDEDDVTDPHQDLVDFHYWEIVTAETLPHYSPDVFSCDYGHGSHNYVWKLFKSSVKGAPPYAVAIVVNK